jgi:hypothetical protein
MTDGEPSPPAPLPARPPTPPGEGSAACRVGYRPGEFRGGGTQSRPPCRSARSPRRRVPPPWAGCGWGWGEARWGVASGTTFSAAHAPSLGDPAPPPKKGNRSPEEGSHCPKRARLARKGQELPTKGTARPSWARLPLKRSASPPFGQALPQKGKRPPNWGRPFPAPKRVKEPDRARRAHARRGRRAAGADPDRAR